MHVIDKMLEVPEATAFRSAPSSPGVAPSFCETLSRTTPEVATAFSVAMFGATGVVLATTCASTSTWAVEE